MNLFEDFVAYVVAKRVIDAFEHVDINEKCGKALLLTLTIIDGLP